MNAHRTSFAYHLASAISILEALEDRPEMLHGWSSVHTVRESKFVLEREFRRFRLDDEIRAAWGAHEAVGGSG